MPRRFKQTIRVLAGLTVFAVLADPVLTVVHLLEHENQHAWCEAHQHVIHLDPHAEPVGSSEVSEDAVWDASGYSAHHHDECAALTALRCETNRSVTVTYLQRPNDEPRLPSSTTASFDDILSLAPKHGPPASA